MAVINNWTDRTLQIRGHISYKLLLTLVAREINQQLSTYFAKYDFPKPRKQKTNINS